MFTKDQIATATEKSATAVHSAQLMQELRELGIARHIHIVENGANSYYDNGDNYITIKHPQEKIIVSNEPSPMKLRHYLEIHQQGETDYLTFCRQAGEAGVAKWVSDLDKMTVTYLDKKGKELLVEAVPAMRA